MEGPGDDSEQERVQEASAEQQGQPKQVGQQPRHELPTVMITPDIFDMDGVTFYACVQCRMQDLASDLLN